MKHGKQASPQDALEVFISLSFLLFCIFQVYYVETTPPPHTHKLLLHQRKTHLYKKEKKHSQKTNNSSEVFAIHIKDKRLVFVVF
jgi:hypothetical protein